jgi:hypothetical protein
MGVECSVVNSTSPYNYDGSVYLTITGGTPPYVISWSNGAQTQIITGLQYGTYTANVTDYYGDFSATTTCNVSTNFAANLEEFFNCTNPLQKLYYIANINFPYPSGDTFTLTSQSGCWVSNGIVTNTGQTFYSYSAITSSGPFEDCTECLPVTPENESTSGMCLTTVTSLGITNQYQFYSAGTMNGYPTWTSTSPNQKIYFNNAINQWSVSGWTLSGIPSLSQNISPPIGIWTVNGAARTVNVTQGNCGTYIIPTIQKVNPTCSNTSNGVINIVNVVGGTPPYTYSLDNIVYQNSNIFNNLQVGSYTIYVKDVIGNVGTGLSVLTGQQPITTYQVNLSFVPATPQTQLTSTSTQKIGNWVVNVTPALPSNRVVNMTIYNTTELSTGNSLYANPLLTYSNTTGTTGTASFNSSSIQTTTNSFANTVSCHPLYKTTGVTRTYQVSISGTGQATGTILQKVTVSNQSVGCTNKGEIKDTISIANITLVNQQPCESISTNVTPITFTTTKTSSVGYYHSGGGIGLGNLG